MAADPILIVDDNPANLKVARFALQGEGYDVRTAADGEEALTVLREFHPRLILMDIQLPGVDGLELTRRLKADPKTRDIVIVAVTAYAMRGDDDKALRAGCDGYITKPLDPIQLPLQVGAYLGHRESHPGVVAAPAVAVRAQAQVRVPRTVGDALGKSLGLVLVVEDNPETRKMFRVTLEGAGYEVIEAADGRAALAQAKHRPPDLVVEDLGLPDMDGFDLAQSLHGLFGAAPVPIVCVTGFLARIDEARAMKGGFARVLVKPVDPFQLLDVVRTSMGKPPPEVASIGQGRKLLVVDDDPLHRKVAKAWFECAGFEVLEARDGVAALELARIELPCAIVSDVLMTRMDGFELCLAVRRDSKLGRTPVILVSSAYVEHADQALARHVGASALILKTGGFEGASQAVAAALSASAPPPPSEPIEIIEGERTERALWQLERQLQEKMRLLQRVTFLEAELAVLAGVANALSRNKVVHDVLGRVLATCLDMVGISKGALFLFEKERLELKHQIGFSEAELPRVHAVFGCEELFSDLAKRGRVVTIPSEGIATELAGKLVVDAGVPSLLLVPMTWSDTAYGVMLLGARTIDIGGEDALAFAGVLGAQMGEAIGLARAFANLAASELRYRTLTENANDAIAVLTPEGVIREVNRRLTEILGYPAEHFIGRHIRDFAAPGRADESVDRYQTQVAAGSGQPISYEILKQDGGVAVMEFSRAAVVIDGEALVLSIGRDVTEYVRAQSQLMVSDRMASVGTLAAGVAHEINNPLAAVLLNLEFALRDTDLLAREVGSPAQFTELQESLRDARDAAERVRQIVRDLKIFSRSAEDRRGPVDTQRVLESTLRMASNEIRHRARLVQTYGNVPAVEANESRLGQVFLNLVVNAAQAIPEGHADRNEIRVTTSIDPSARVVVEIRDTGPGIQPDTLRHIFDPFFTTKPPGVGTGLGLAICQRIVAELGGEITVESQIGVGTAFKVYLLPSIVEAVEEVSVSAAKAATRRGRIMLIDDDQMVGSAVRRTLSGEHDVVVLTSAQEALATIVAGQRFDVILCDMMMPVVTGMEFYDQLLQAVPEQAERVVFLTGGAFTVRAREFLDRVPNVRIEKPFEVQNLRALVNERVR